MALRRLGILAGLAEGCPQGCPVHLAAHTQECVGGGEAAPATLLVSSKHCSQPPPPEQRQREGHKSGAAGVDKTQGRLASDATCPWETLMSHGHYQSQLYIIMGNIGGLESHASGNLLRYLLLYVILSGCFQINCH